MSKNEILTCGEAIRMVKANKKDVTSFLMSIQSLPDGRYRLQAVEDWIKTGVSDPLPK